MNSVIAPILRRSGRVLLGLSALVWLSGCATNVLSVHSDFMMGLSTKTRAEPRPLPASCADDRLKQLPECTERASWERLSQQVTRLNHDLSQAAILVFPDLKQRFPEIEKKGFDVMIVEDERPGIASSGLGRIAIHAGMRHLQATDDWIAFVMAVEIGRIAAGHHEQNAALSIGAGLLTTATAGASLLASAGGFMSGEVLRAGAASTQDREALTNARAILAVAGIKERQLLINLRVGFNRDALGDSTWAQRYTALENVVLREEEAANLAATMRAQYLERGPVAE